MKYVGIILILVCVFALVGCAALSEFLDDHEVGITISGDTTSQSLGNDSTVQKTLATLSTQYAQAGSGYMPKPSLATAKTY